MRVGKNFNTKKYRIDKNCNYSKFEPLNSKIANLKKKFTMSNSLKRKIKKFKS